MTAYEIDMHANHQAVYRSGVGTIGQTTQPIDSATNMTSECLATVHELNLRLRNCADRISGSVPSPANAGSKDTSQPSLLDTLRYLRNALSSAHEELIRIECGI